MRRCAWARGPPGRRRPLPRRERLPPLLLRRGRFLHQGQLLFCEEKDALLERYGILNDTAEQAEALRPEAIAAKTATPYGGVRALVRRDLAPAGFQLEKPTIEDIILFLAKGETQ